jgi:hypothetical protein
MESEKKEKGRKVEAKVKSELKFMDDGFEDQLTKYIDGASFQSVAAELKELHLDENQKRALFRSSVCAAIGNRRTLSDVTTKEVNQVSSLRGFMLNNVISMAKLTIIGHALLRTTHTGRIGVLWRAKLNGALSIYETSTFVGISDKRLKVIELVKQKRVFSADAADDIVKVIMD